MRSARRSSADIGSSCEIVICTQHVRRLAWLISSQFPGPSFHHVRDDCVRSSGRSNAKEALPCDTACCDFNLSVTDGDAHIRTSSCGDGYRRHDVVPRTPTSDNTLSAWRVHCRDHYYLPAIERIDIVFPLSDVDAGDHRAHAAHLIVAVSRPHRATDRRFLALTLAAMAATTPFSAALFSQLPLVSPVANLVVAPLFTLALTVSLVGSVASLAAPLLRRSRYPSRTEPLSCLSRR